MTTSIVQQFINSIPDKRVANAVSEIFKRITPSGVDTAITAHAGGTQAAAMALKPTASFHDVTTVATAADSILLPPANVGEFHFVKNSAAANAMQVFGAGTDTIDSVATATGVSQLAGDAVLYVCLVKGNYIRLGGVSATETFTAITTATINATTSVTTPSLVLGATAVVATGAELNRACDVSTRVVNCTASTLAVTEADHDGKTIVLDLAAGIAVTLPVASAGLKFKFIVKTTFTGAASIKSVAGADIMVGHAIMGNDTDNTTVRWPAVAADTFDTIDLLGTGNSTGGMAGQIIEIEGLAANLWNVRIIGDAAGTEATPFANTVA